MICVKWGYLCLLVVLLTDNQPVECATISKKAIHHEELEQKEALAQIADELVLFMDNATDPCDDFYKYACGNFEIVHPIPPEQSSFDVDALIENKLKDISRQFLQSPVDPDTNPNDAATKVKNLYRMCLDMEKRRETGVQPLLQFIQDMGGWHALNNTSSNTTFDWIEVLGNLSQYGYNSLVPIYVNQDYANPIKSAIILGEDFPLEPIPRSEIETNVEALELNRKFCEDVLVLSGFSRESAVEMSEDILKFSIELAKLSVDDEDVDDFRDHFERMTVAELALKSPEINWQKLFNLVFGRPISPDQVVTIMAKVYYDELPKLLARTDPKTLANYIFWRAFEPAMMYLDDRYDDVIMTYKRTLYGIKEQRSLEERCLRSARSYISRPVEAFFVRNHFNRESKNVALKMTESLRKSLRNMILEKEWLDEETKANVLEKLENMVFLMGYNDDLLSDEKVNEKYEKAELIPDNYFGSVVNLVRVATMESREKLDKEWNRTEWQHNAMSVNAYYSRVLNRIAIPAGHLQPPYYNRHYPQAINFGAMGMVIGHEMTHAFDKGGRTYNSLGMMQESWSNKSATTFDDMSECFVDQYSNFEKYNTSLRGRATADENISDTGGIRLAYNAYIDWLFQNLSPENFILPGLGLNDKQLFFLAYAHSWCSSSRQKSLLLGIKSGVHSPPEFRIRGSLSNLPEFSEAFNCPVGSGMNPEKKCNIF